MATTLSLALCKAVGFSWVRFDTIEINDEFVQGMAIGLSGLNVCELFE